MPILQDCHYNMYTVEPPHKGHVGNNINSAVLSFIERLSSFRGSKCTKTIGHVIFGISNSVHCREVYYIVSLFRRFHCMTCHAKRVLSDGITISEFLGLIHSIEIWNPKFHTHTTMVESTKKFNV